MARIPVYEAQQGLDTDRGGLPRYAPLDAAAGALQQRQAADSEAYRPDQYQGLAALHRWEYEPLSERSPKLCAAKATN